MEIIKYDEVGYAIRQDACNGFDISYTRTTAAGMFAIGIHSGTLKPAQHFMGRERDFTMPGIMPRHIPRITPQLNK